MSPYRPGRAHRAWPASARPRRPTRPDQPVNGRRPFGPRDHHGNGTRGRDQLVNGRCPAGWRAGSNGFSARSLTGPRTGPATGAIRREGGRVKRVKRSSFVRSFVTVRGLPAGPRTPSRQLARPPATPRSPGRNGPPTGRARPPVRPSVPQGPRPHRSWPAVGARRPNLTDRPGSPASYGPTGRDRAVIARADVPGSESGPGGAHSAIPPMSLSPTGESHPRSPRAARECAGRQLADGPLCFSGEGAELRDRPRRPPKRADGQLVNGRRRQSAPRPTPGAKRPSRPGRKEGRKKGQGSKETTRLPPKSHSPTGQIITPDEETGRAAALAPVPPPLQAPGAAGPVDGEVCLKPTNLAKDRADAQRLVATRLLDRLHDPLGHFSRLQRIHPRAR